MWENTLYKLNWEIQAIILGTHTNEGGFYGCSRLSPVWNRIEKFAYKYWGFNQCSYPWQNLHQLTINWGKSSGIEWDLLFFEFFLLRELRNRTPRWIKNIPEWVAGAMRKIMPRLKAIAHAVFLFQSTIRYIAEFTPVKWRMNSKPQ